MRPRVFLSLCLSALSVAAVACTALLGDFQEGVVETSDASDPARLDATSDAAAGADAGSPHINYSCKAGKARFVTSFSTGVPGDGSEAYFLHAPDGFSQLPSRVSVTQLLGGDAGGFVGTRTYLLEASHEADGGVRDLEGSLLAAQDFPGGIAALTFGFGSARGIFLSKLYDNAPSWTGTFLVSDTTIDDCAEHVHAGLHVVDQANDDYIVVWAVAARARDDAGACGAELPMALYARHFVRGRPSPVHRMDPGGTLLNVHFTSSPIAVFDGGVMTLLEATFADGGERQVFQLSTSDMEPTSHLAVPRTLSGDDGGAFGIAVGISGHPSPSDQVRSAFFVLDNAALAIHVGSILVDRWAETDVQRDLTSTPIRIDETFFTHTVARWSDFANGDSPHSLLINGTDQTSNTHRFFWLDADGREHARLSVDADGGPFRGVQMARTSFNGAALSGFRVVFLRTEPLPDGGAEPPPLSMWTYDTVCTAVDAGL